MANGDAIAIRKPLHISGVDWGSQLTYQVDAMKYGIHVKKKLPVVNITTLMAFHLEGCLGPGACVGSNGDDLKLNNQIHNLK